MLAFALAAPALAQPAGEVSRARARLTLATPDACPSEANVAAAVEALLERQVFVDGDPDVLVHGELERAGAGWRAMLRLERADGETVGTRELLSEGAACHDLMATLPLVLALMVDLPKTHVSLRIPVPDSVAEAPAPPPPPVPSPPPSEPPPSEGPSFDLELGAVSAFGWLPGTALGAAAGLGLGMGRFRIALRAYLHPPWTADAARGELRTWAAGAGLRGAVDWIRGTRGSLGGFLEIAVGRFEARSIGVTESLTARGPTLDLLGGVRSRLRLGPLWLGLELGLGVPLIPPRFAVQVGSSPVEVFAAPPIFGRLGLQIGLSTAGL